MGEKRAKQLHVFQITPLQRSPIPPKCAGCKLIVRML